MGPTLYRFYNSEEKLAESEKIFQTIVDTSIEGIVIVQGSKMVFVNPSLEAMLGVDKGELRNNFV